MRRRRPIKSRLRQLFIRGREQKTERERYIFSIDNPTKKVVTTRRTKVSGWVVGLGAYHVQAVRCYHAGTYYSLKYGKSRADVIRLHPLAKGADQLCGFEGFINISEGELRIEVDFGEGFKTIWHTLIRYAAGSMFDAIYNPEEAINRAEHLTYLNDKHLYYHEDNIPHTYQRGAKDPRLVALYLPQFHPIPENDKAWGEGFTEWRNVGAATPRFVGHWQPILPSSLGYYDLRLEDVLQQQIRLAKQHGIHGFCFYYYWFSGKKVLDLPLNTFCRHKDWDFNFTICWANENWTRRWDGRSDDVILEQKYRKEDPLDFIKDIESILMDKRYVRENNKPLLIVYRAQDLQDPAYYAKVWRDYMRGKYHIELQLIAVMGFDDVDPRTYGFDAALDFVPQTTFFKKQAFEKGVYPFLDVKSSLLDISFSGSVVDYRKLALNRDLYGVFPFPTYKSVMPHWDNDARRKGTGFIFQGSNPDMYGDWLQRVIEIEKAQKVAPIIFLNAWNEWAEGAVLEPTVQYGHAFLNRTTEVLSRYSSRSVNALEAPLFGMRQRTREVEIAVIVHLFYSEDWPSLKQKLAKINVPYSLFVTTPIKAMALNDSIVAFKKDAQIKVVPNRGGDTLPFIFLAQRVKIYGYKYILKLCSSRRIATNATAHTNNVIHGLLSSSTQVDAIIQHLKKGNAFIGAEDDILYVDSKADTKKLLKKIGQIRVEESLRKSQYQNVQLQSNMFWCRSEALSWLLDCSLTPDDFSAERHEHQDDLERAIQENLLALTSLFVVDKSISVCSKDGINQLYPNPPVS